MEPELTMGQVQAAAALFGIETEWGDNEGRWYANIAAPPYPVYYPDAHGSSENECAEMLRQRIQELLKESWRCYEYVHHRAVIKGNAYLSQRMDSYFAKGGMSDRLKVGTEAGDD